MNLTFSRKRRFKPAESGHLTWWLVGIETQPGAVNEGLELIQILETVETETCGTLAIYKQWITDPDGAEVHTQWTPKRQELRFRRWSTLQGSMQRMGFSKHAV